MIRHWDLKPDPNISHPKKHRLFIDGDSVDIILILKKMGNVCGRPQKADKPYTYALPVMTLDEAVAAKLKDTLSKVAEQRRQGRHQHIRQIAGGVDENLIKLLQSLAASKSAESKPPAQELREERVTEQPVQDSNFNFDIPQASQPEPQTPDFDLKPRQDDIFEQTHPVPAQQEQPMPEIAPIQAIEDSTPPSSALPELDIRPFAGMEQPQPDMAEGIQPAAASEIQPQPEMRDTTTPAQEDTSGVEEIPLDNLTDSGYRKVAKAKAEKLLEEARAQEEETAAQEASSGMQEFSLNELAPSKPEPAAQPAQDQPSEDDVKIPDYLEKELKKLENSISVRITQKNIPPKSKTTKGPGKQSEPPAADKKVSVPLAASEPAPETAPKDMPEQVKADAGTAAPDSGIPLQPPTDKKTTQRVPAATEPAQPPVPQAATARIPPPPTVRIPPPPTQTRREEPKPELPVTPPPAVTARTQPPAPQPVAQKPAEQEKAPPAVPAPETAKPEEQDPRLSRKTKKISVIPQESPAAPAAIPEPAPETPEPTPQPPEGTTSRRRRSIPLEIPLIPTYNFDSMIVGGNRFAHAAGMSVVENPGSMYNPLMLHGSAGCGKSHLFHAIAYGISKSVGQEKIIVTDGVRFSKAIQRMVKDGQADKLEAMMDNTKAIFIDDIHLMILTETNRKVISKWLNSFVQQGKQVVVTSLYPPKNLVKLESTLAFQLNQGWIVELKTPTASNYKAIVNNMLGLYSITISEDEISNFFLKPAPTLDNVIRFLRRAKGYESLVPWDSQIQSNVLEKMITPHDHSGGTLPTQDDISSAAAFTAPQDQSWGKWGFFCPEGFQDYIKWVKYKTMESAAALKVEGGFDTGLEVQYGTENIMLSAFKISDISDDKQLSGAIIIGPGDGTDPKMAEDFQHAVSHLLKTLGVKFAYIDMRELKSDTAYARLLMDMRGI